MKWLPVVLLGIVGVLAAFVCVEYLTVSIHSLPSYIPGRRPVNGRYHVRGAIAGLVAIVAFAGAVVLAIRIARPGEPKPEVLAPQASSPDDLLGGGPAAPNT